MRKRFFILPLLFLASFVSGYGQSLRFNGSNNYVNIGNSGSLQLKDFTLEAWINIQGSGATTGTQQGNEKGGFKASTVVPLIAKGHREKGSAATAINYFFGYQASDRRLVADFEDNATGDHHTIIGNTPLPTNTWVHVAVTYTVNSNNKSIWTLYINGAPDLTTTLSGIYTPQSGSTVTTAIASSLNSGGSAEGFFNGMMDEVRIWNIVRSASDIFDNYKLEISSAATGLVARYGFNEGTGTTTANSVTGTNTGKLINSPQWTLGFNQTAPANQPPVLDPIGNQTIAPGQTLSFTATATDPDAGQTLTFSLLNAPIGATIGSSSGVFSWTPASAGTYTFTVRVSDNGSPILTDDEQITVTVSATNQAPVLASIGSKTVVVNQSLNFTASATDPDVGQALTFSLVNAPAGAAINGSSGAFSWTPTATGTYTFTVRVSDNGSPVMTDEEQITVTVTDTNHPPVLGTIGNQNATVGQALTFTASATDPDAGQTLTFSLINAPSGATINATTGAFSWTPSTQGTYTFTVQVSDNGSPVMTDGEQITVTVTQASTNQATALRFNGSNNYVYLGNDASFSLQSFTLEAWIKPMGAGITTSTGSGGITAVPIITKGRAEADAPTNVNMNYFLGIDANNMLVADFEEASGPNHPVVSTTAITNNVWTYVAATYDPASAVWKLYVNGTLVTTKDVGTNIIPASVSIQPAAIGSALNSTGVADGYFNGAIDEVRIWNVVRTATDISANYNAELTSGTGLAARYGFNEGSGTTAENSAGSISGQLMNRPVWTTGFNVNEAPVLNPIGNQTATVGLALTFTATATDPNVGQSLIFSLSSAPTGAFINSSTGAFSWTPANTGTYTFTVQVSDNGSPVMTDAEQITVTVNPASTNPAPSLPASPSPADAGSSSYNTTSLCVTASDPNNDPLRVRFYGRKKVTKEKFAIIIVPDTQVYTEEPQGTSGAYNTMFKSQMNWIANNRIAKNIAYVGHLGDCVEHGDTFELEWKRVDTAMRSIEDSTTTGLIQGIPFGVCVGNHDQSLRGDPLGTTTFYNKYFGTARFNGRSYYGGHNGTNGDNHYELFSVGGIDFLVICPEYDQTSNFTAPGGALDWGENLIKAYPNRKVIVMTHYVLTGSAAWSAQGQALYNRYKIYPNVIMMIGGHISANTGESRRTDTYNGNTIQSVVSDYQSRTNGGNGLMRIYTFDPATNTVATQTYSPYTNAFETDASSQFTLNVNLATTPDAYTLLGEVSNASSGTNVCVNWPSLLDNTTYEWYAEVWDGTTTTTGPVWSFKTKSVTNVVTNSISTSQPLALIREDQSATSIGSFTIYPNPDNTKHFTISLPAEIKGAASVEIVDLTGKVQFRKNYNSVSNSLSITHNLAHGTYMVVLKSGNFISTKKLVVIE